MFVLTGPPELMPEEGLNKQQRKQLALLEAAQVCAWVCASDAHCLLALLEASCVLGSTWGCILGLCLRN
jgi:hypothetical protein